LTDKQPPTPITTPPTPSSSSVATEDKRQESTTPKSTKANTPAPQNYVDVQPEAIEVDDDSSSDDELVAEFSKDQMVIDVDEQNKTDQPRPEQHTSVMEEFDEEDDYINDEELVNLSSRTGADESIANSLEFDDEDDYVDDGGLIKLSSTAKLSKKKPANTVESTSSSNQAGMPPPYDTLAQALAPFSELVQFDVTSGEENEAKSDEENESSDEEVDEEEDNNLVGLVREPGLGKRKREDEDDVEVEAKSDVVDRGFASSTVLAPAPSNDRRPSKIRQIGRVALTLATGAVIGSIGTIAALVASAD